MRLELQKSRRRTAPAPLPWAACMLWDKWNGSMQKKGECTTCLQNLGTEPNQPSQPSTVLSGSNTCGRLNLSSRLSHNPYRLSFLSMQILKPIFHLLWFKLPHSLSLWSLFTHKLPFLPSMYISLLLSPKALTLLSGARLHFRGDSLKAPTVVLRNTYPTSPLPFLAPYLLSHLQPQSWSFLIISL